MDGILLVDKPAGISSYDAIRDIKKTGYKGKIGHAGTLDVFAEGLLILLLGKGTKKFGEFQNMKKEYVAVAKLGYYCPTLDVDGEVVKKGETRKIDKDEFEKAARRFLGKIKQRIPDYSATKIKGKTRYSLARKGVKLEDKFKEVEIGEIEILEIEESAARFKAVVSSGTYIRQLSYDMFLSLGVESVLEKLTRTRVGKYKLEDALSLSEVKNWQEKVIEI